MLPRQPTLNVTALLAELDKLTSPRVVEQNQEIELQQRQRKNSDILQQLLNTLIDTFKKMLSLSEHHNLAREFNNPHIQKMFTSMNNYIIKNLRVKTPYEILRRLQDVSPEFNQYIQRGSQQKLVLFFTAIDQMNLDAPSKEDVDQLCKALTEIHHTWRRPSMTLESIEEAPLPSRAGLFSSTQMSMGKVVRKSSSSSASPLVSPVATPLVTPLLTPLISPHETPPLLSP